MPRSRDKESLELWLAGVTNSAKIALGTMRVDRGLKCNNWFSGVDCFSYFFCDSKERIRCGYVDSSTMLQGSRGRLQPSGRS